MRQATLDIINKITEIKSAEDLGVFKRGLSKKYGFSILLNSDILKEYSLLIEEKKISKKWLAEYNDFFISLLKKRAIRTMSGIAPVAVLTKPYPCPGKCAYCPQKPNVPVSYLSNEPAVMRAIRLNYNPYLQTIFRLKALENNGHKPNKIELIVIGGTWSYLPEKYKYWYVLNCFKAANDYQKKKSKILIKKSKKTENKKTFSDDIYFLKFSLKDLKKFLLLEQKKNEKSKYNIIGLTLETRPDYLDEKELWQMRELGCTRIEIGVQAIDDEILKLNRRGHDISAIAKATQKMKNYGFKVTYHFMPALPGSNPKKDIKMFKQLYNDERFQPDQIKFYPTTVVKDSLLYTWWKQGKYRPYSDEELEAVIVECKKNTPVYTRIIRLIRDIPGESIEAGNKITNLRQIMKDRGVVCNCIRCREAKNKVINKKDLKLNILKYKASEGLEYFISFDSLDGKILYGFCRLRIDYKSAVAKALIRELHVYGQLVPKGGEKKVQHSGLGKRLMAEAEKIARKNKAKKVAVISGVGVRGYYRKLGYRLEKTYMVKNFLK
ncbi:tRNA uridine(34) 5-carboxymethylaminomethyl modification radical SAM/GNAT enzyme Elp3 [Candidatus Falkowbacteria bacterium HGW-Falkowbacteria-1]|uniref:tRNA carboxymethyluridine synthase n=1 Tax=Candidatus Falkowbacteria bacterium HGW-Falkowbacteria-1 TaxID=2013768 RepID=A0A2N2E966_9BACT|nr:MAG: tRNA uridine(34) 5-carboxymethylaminomethyl modification radical SAM/GNAT enzyme Elp3 [Candidatus Falkowbacteria bacterium HGW-Falkowbacteria-1]